MKQISESIIKSTKSVLGGWTKVTTLGCMLALVFLVAASVQSQPPRPTRPFKATGIFTLGSGGTFKVVGTATHLGKIVFTGGSEVVSATDTGTGLAVTLHIQGTYTAANGDTIEIECPDWVTQYDSGGNPVTSTGLVNIIGGTGRFANASGSYAGAIFPGDTLTFSANGTISY